MARLSSVWQIARSCVWNDAFKPEHQEALAALEQAYGQLAEALLVAARNNGYLGTEPLGALSHLLRPRIEDHQLGGAVRELWINFFNSFRPDEQAFEAKEFLDRASKLNQTLHELGTEEDLKQRPRNSDATDFERILAGASTCIKRAH